jgi:hypothetical protein
MELPHRLPENTVIDFVGPTIFVTFFFEFQALVVVGYYGLWIIAICQVVYLLRDPFVKGLFDEVGMIDAG